MRVLGTLRRLVSFASLLTWTSNHHDQYPALPKDEKAKRAVVSSHDHGRAVAHLVRLFVGLLALWSCNAFATIPLIPAHFQWGWNDPPLGPNALGWVDSPQTACDNSFPLQKAYYAGRLTGSGFTLVDAYPSMPGHAYTCWGILDGVNRGIYNLLRMSIAASCPANSAGTTSCTCNAAYQEDPTQTSCIPAPPEPLAAPSGGNSCKVPSSSGYIVGKPILPATGEKYVCGQ